jgi:hypothetical protein
MRFVILHYHFFKNAGSTVENILDEYFGERFCRLDTPDPQACLPNADLLSHLHAHQNLCAVASHQIRHPVPAAPGFLFFDLCFLRDPLDRIGSIYYYLREKPGEGNLLSDLAVRYELRDFLTFVMEHLPHYVNNVQVNLLATGGQGHDSPTREDLDCAVRRMLETSFLGVVDCFYESLIAGQYLLSPVFPGFDSAQLPVNVSNRVGETLESRIGAMKEACGEQVFVELMRLNALDAELLRLARAEVRRRFELVPDGARRLLQVKTTLERDTVVKLPDAPA